MNVQLQVGYTMYVMPIADAAKVMELLSKAQACESYWIGEYQGHDSESGLRMVKGESLMIQQTNVVPITTEEYEWRYAPYREARDAEKLAKIEAE